jgi:hypothetical protein
MGLQGPVTGCRIWDSGSKLHLESHYFGYRKRPALPVHRILQRQGRGNFTHTAFLLSRNYNLLTFRKDGCFQWFQALVAQNHVIVDVTRFWDCVNTQCRRKVWRKQWITLDSTEFYVDVSIKLVIPISVQTFTNLLDVYKVYIFRI